MNVLFDQGTPVPLRRYLHPHVVDTADELGWSRLQNGDLLDQAELNKLGKSLAERARITQITARDNNPVRHLEAQLLDDPEHYGFLPFEPKWVQRINKVHPQLGAHRLHLPHTIVEVAENLYSMSAVVHRLAEFTERDPARADEHCALQAATVGIQRH